MSKIGELINKLCPNGVEFKELGEIGFFYGGLTGKKKDDFMGGNFKYITYMNIFNNIEVDTNINTYVKLNINENQNKIEFGDVLFTGSSETPDECGMSSVLTKKIDEPLYLNSFSFGFRLFNKDLFLPGFMKFLFRDSGVRNQIAKTASGVTRFNISKKYFAKIKIPIPPLEVQEEIVRILDTFTALISELKAELEARKKQYAYYRNKLLNFVGKNVEWKTLGEVAHYPKYRISANLLDKTSYVGVENLLQNRMGKTFSNYVPTVGNFIEFKIQDILIGNIRPYLKKIWYSDINGGTNGDVLVIRINNEFKNQLDSRFLYFLLSSDSFFNYNMKFAKGAKMPRGDKEAILKYLVPLPPLSEQQRIVEILDKFDTLVNDLSIGIPAEIEARQKQYEYYRNKLLSFKEINNE